MLRDDPWNSYACNATTGKYDFNWNWLECCTDGMVLGPLPNKFGAPDGFDVTFEADCAHMTGLAQGTRISMWNPRGPAYSDPSSAACYATTGSAADWIHYDVPMALSCSHTKGIQIKAEPCAHLCGAIDNCGECTSHPGCGWHHGARPVSPHRPPLPEGAAVRAGCSRTARVLAASAAASPTHSAACARMGVAGLPWKMAWRGGASRERPITPVSRT